jgi:hypothetical protein
MTNINLPEPDGLLLGALRQTFPDATDDWLAEASVNLGAYLDHVAEMYEEIVTDPERHQRFKLALLEERVREWQESEAQIEKLRMKRGHRR